MGIGISPALHHAVGVFAEGRALGTAYRELVDNGFGPLELCVMAVGSVVDGYLGARAALPSRDLQMSDGDDRFLKDLMATLGLSGVHCTAGPIHASSGPICDHLGLHDSRTGRSEWFSDILGRWIARRSAEYLEDRLGEGKILLWVQTGNRENANREHRACAILLQHASESVRVLDFAFIR